MTSYAELAAATNFSFLTGASQPAEMVAAAIALGHQGLGIADRNSVAGVVRAWRALKDAREAGQGIDFRLLSGARLGFVDGTPDIIAYPANRAGWGRLTRLLSHGNLQAAKGDCILTLGDLIAWCDDLLLIIMPPPRLKSLPALLTRLRARTPDLWLAAPMNRAGRDKRRLAELAALALAHDVPLLAVNDALYAGPEARPLHDILTCIREGLRIEEAGRVLSANAERYLKPAAEMARLFADAPHALAEITGVLARISFDLGDLSYDYPHEPVPAGLTPQAWLEQLVGQKAAARWPGGT
ncbi:MAG: hypothetical protein RL367_1108, partial [Pseudomonadota bacterium]